MDSMSMIEEGMTVIIKNEEVDFNNRTISMHNDLSVAQHSLELNERRLMFGCIQKLDSRKRMAFQRGIKRQGDRTFFTLTAKEFAKMYDLSMNSAYRVLEEAAISLYKREIIFSTREKKPKVTMARWVDRATYHKGEAWVEISFSRDIEPYLTSLHTQFTSYKFDYIARLRSTYSHRMIDLIMKNQNLKTNSFTLTLDAFCEIMQCPETYKGIFQRIKEKIIIPVCKELLLKSNITLLWEVASKTGKKVNSIKFTFALNKQHQLANA